MTENGFHYPGTSAYDVAFMAWQQVSAETCRCPDSDEGHWVQGLLTGMLAWRTGYSAEQAAGIVRAARAGAAIVHGTELVTRRDLL